MNKDRERYSIKAGYRENLVQATYDSSENPDYWNEGRLKSAASYQYDVYLTAAKLARKHHFRTLLDIGSGPPVKLSELMPDDIEISLVDQPNTARHAEELLPSAHFFSANLENALPPIDKMFDLILCADVIEHLVNPDPCLEFMRRHLAPQGLLLISTPERDSLRGKACMHSPHPMHVREWSLDEFAHFLLSRNLDIVEHRLLPQQRTSSTRKLLGGLMAALGRPPTWYSCQLAICRSRN